MPPTCKRITIPPRRWSANVKPVIPHTISPARLAISHARAWVASVVNPRTRQAAEIERLEAEGILLREELDIKDARLSRILPANWPHHAPQERMRILQLKAVRVLSAAQTAHALLVDQQTGGNCENPRRIRRKRDRPLEVVQRAVTLWRGVPL